MANVITISEYDQIARGTSITIPVLMKRLDDTPFDLTEYTASFTMKGVEYDYDYDDARARIAKPLEIQFPEEGRFDIQLSSHETWLPPGTYYFDIELERDGAIARIAFFRTTIVGGPSNRRINRAETPISFSNTINIQMGGTSPIVFITPLISDPPENLIETVQATPAYLLEHLDPPDEPVRNIMIHNYAPKVSFAMSFFDINDALPHTYQFQAFSFPELPDCPLIGGHIQIDRREVTLHLREHGDMKVWDRYTQHSPEITHDAHFYRQFSNEPFFVGDNVTAGELTIVIDYAPRRSIHIKGNYTMPRYVSSSPHPAVNHSHWHFRIDYFDWDAPAPHDL